jgi:hypothetical protein
MNNPTNDLISQPARHLTNEQFDALLFSQATDHPHLQTCTLCATQLSELRSSIGDLRVTSVAAAERHYSSAVSARATRQRSRLQPRLTWAATAFAGVLFISLPFVSRFRAPKTPVQTRVAVANVPAPKAADSNLSDAQLLSSIQNDLSATVPDPLLPLDSTSTSTTAVK